MVVSRVLPHRDWEYRWPFKRCTSLLNGHDGLSSSNPSIKPIWRLMFGVLDFSFKRWHRASILNCRLKECSIHWRFVERNISGMLLYDFFQSFMISGDGWVSCHKQQRKCSMTLRLITSTGLQLHLIRRRLKCHLSSWYKLSLGISYPYQCLLSCTMINKEYLILSY